MALLKQKEISGMNKTDAESKLKELKFELIKANVAANKTNAKTKEIKRAISRLTTMSNNQNKSEKTNEKGALNIKEA